MGFRGDFKIKQVIYFFGLDGICVQTYPQKQWVTLAVLLIKYY